MRLVDVARFRKDLLFNGAVQISWLEDNKKLAEKAATNFVFHGPEYHGVNNERYDSEHQLVDTANFTLDVIKRISGEHVGDPFILAIAGYGTGKSHLGVTLASLLSNPKSEISTKILENIRRVDNNIYNAVSGSINTVAKPYLIVSINGMNDFDLTSEITRQVLNTISLNGLDTKPLENLRPRFKTATNFTNSFFEPLVGEYKSLFGDDISKDQIVHSLSCQDEDAFKKVSQVYENRMGSPIRAIGQESLNDFIKVTKEAYCGRDKPFEGVLILFDEFGRYLEFAVQKPHVAGSGVLQQLFEAVQSNDDKVFLVCFIQYELKAYISRVAPELRDELNRYVTRYDAVRKVRLSTNMETLIANLIEKPNEGTENSLSSYSTVLPPKTHQKLLNWFPEMKNHSLWHNEALFNRVVCKGCWPLHPVSTWMLYKLSAVGKSLQQRSALSILAEVYEQYENEEIHDDFSLYPTNFCVDSLINEFVASERTGQYGSIGHSYENVISKYQYQFNREEIAVLKSILLATKTGFKVTNKEDCQELISIFSGVSHDNMKEAVNSLEREYGILSWNDVLNQYEITGDAIPRRAFENYLDDKVRTITSITRSELFNQNYQRWSEKDEYNTDFGTLNHITTKDWNYNITYTNVMLLEAHMDYAIKRWKEAYAPDTNKGQLLYCYVGPESDIDIVKNNSKKAMNALFESNDISIDYGLPLAVVFLYDTSGNFAERYTKYWIIENQLNDDEKHKFNNFILDTKNRLLQEMENYFNLLEKERIIIIGSNNEIALTRTKVMLTELLQAVYPHIVSFDFDGFHTARGNAAKDSQFFTKELIVGRLDKEFISTCIVQQRNRAHKLFDESWNIFEDDGSVRLKPQNSKIRYVIELIEKLFDSEESGNVNIRKIFDMLCKPPFGCNIASAGLIFALYVGRRKDRLNLVHNGESISFENWLSEAMSKNFFDLDVLELSEIYYVSEEKISEWENLMEEWNSERTILGNILYRNKSEELKRRISVPPQLYYKYTNLVNQTKNLQQKLIWYDDTLGEAKDKFYTGQEDNNLNYMIRGAVNFWELSNKMQVESHIWAEEQKKEVNSEIASARVHIKKVFPQLLPSIRVAGVAQLSRFIHEMNNAAKNLETLDLRDEKERLLKHVEMIEDNIKQIESIKTLEKDMESFMSSNVIGDNTKMTVLNEMKLKISDFNKRIAIANKRPELITASMVKTAKKMQQYSTKIVSQKKDQKDRLDKVFNIDNIDNIESLYQWKDEVGALLNIYEDDERNIEDIKQIQFQLNIFDEHFRKMLKDSYSAQEFNKLVDKCIIEVEERFSHDAPPLVHEEIYKNFAHNVRIQKTNDASQWIEENIPKIDEIQRMNAKEVYRIKTKLDNRPLYMSEKQDVILADTYQSCIKRLESLELESLVAQYGNLSEVNKSKFIKKIVRQGEKYLENILPRNSRIENQDSFQEETSVYLSSSRNNIVVRSWTILSNRVFVKRIDKSCIEHNGSGLPREIVKFWDESELIYKEAQPIQLVFDGELFEARLEVVVTDSQRARIMWPTDFSKKILKTTVYPINKNLNGKSNNHPQHLVFTKMDGQIFFVNTYSDDIPTGENI